MRPRWIGRLGGSGRQRARLQALLMGTTLTLAAAAGLVRLCQGAAPAAAGFLQDTVLLAGAAAMPEGTWNTLMQRSPAPSSSAASEVQPGVTLAKPDPPQQKPAPAKPPEIPQEYRGTLLSETMVGSPSAVCWQIGTGWLRNYTEIPRARIEAELQKPLEIAPKADGRVEVLIMHTHATESFEPYDSEIYDTRHTWRSTDNSENIVAAGEVMAQAIRAHGIEVLHDDTQHDYPSYNGSYERSAETVKGYLAKYPSIKVVLDVHRDAVQRDSTLVKPITQINGKKAAQMMIIAGCDDGTMEMPNWGKNLRFAAGIQDAIESRWKGLTRPIFFCYRKYNQDLTTGSLLLELGSHGNTLEQVLTTAQLAGDAIGNYLAQECMAE